jgi:hypothetical protein
LGTTGKNGESRFSACSSKQFGRQVPPDYELRSGLWSAGELCVRHRHRDFEVIGLSVQRVEVGSGALTEASAAVLESRQRVLAQLPCHCSAPICAAARVPISLSAAVQPGDIHHSGCRP